jgi:hypothetical protein
MRFIAWMTLIGLLALAGCGSGSQVVAPGAPDPETASALEAPGVPDPETGRGLDTSYEDALTLRNQLALGTLRLEETDWPVTADQASDLLLLWQVLRGTIGSGVSAPAEVDAVQEQIEGAMTAEQLAAIGDMRLTQADLQVWAQSQSLNMTQGSGLGAGQRGSGRDLSEEERATRQAERGGSGNAGSGTSQALIDAVIGLLETR